jgi:hypothetical protein
MYIIRMYRGSQYKHYLGCLILPTSNMVQPDMHELPVHVVPEIATLAEHRPV